MASKLFSRIASKFFGKKAAKRATVLAPAGVVPTAPLPAPMIEDVPIAAVQEDLTPLSRQERDTNFNPVLLKVGNITNHLSPGATLTGDLVLTQGGIRLKCRVDGSVTQASNDLLIVDHDAVITGAVHAKYLLVLGEINGDLEADRIVVGASARITGDITYRRSFGSVTGAKIRGRITEVEQTAVVHQMAAPTADLAPEAASASTPQVAVDDDEEVYFPRDNRSRVFDFPSVQRNDAMNSAMPDVRFAVN
jgi:cytoskeletal protein CcmA (bactofilin family)